MNNSLRVWHIPQIGMTGEPFYIDVKSLQEAAKVLNILADYDLYQFDNHIKPDYANIGGLQELFGNHWFEWIDPDLDDDIWKFIENLKTQKREINHGQ